MWAGHVTTGNRPDGHKIYVKFGQVRKTKKLGKTPQPIRNCGMVKQWVRVAIHFHTSEGELRLWLRCRGSHWSTLRDVPIMESLPQLVNVRASRGTHWFDLCIRLGIKFRSSNSDSTFHKPPTSIPYLSQLELLLVGLICFPTDLQRAPADGEAGGTRCPCTWLNRLITRRCQQARAL